MCPDWRLRCVFHYHDGKPSWKSQWDRTGPGIKDCAWAQSKENLARAIIEGKHRVTAEERVFAECAGQDFCNFEWYAMTAAPLRLGARNPSFQPTPHVVGLVLVTRDERVIVHKNGFTKIVTRTEDEKRIQLAGYGK